LAENPFLWSTTAADNDDADPAVPYPEGMLPGSVNNAARAQMAAVARLIKDLNGTLTTAGSANAYTLTSSCGHSALTNGILITAKASFTNTAAATLNLNTFGAKAIKVFTSGAEADAAAGQIISGGTYQFRYDAALASAAGAWLLLNPSPDPLLLDAVGEIKIWPHDTAPDRWFFCNGEAISRVGFVTLFNKIGTTFGVGDGVASFNLPDLCGRSPFGTDDMGGITLKNRVTNAGSGIVGTTLGASGGTQSVVLDSTMIPSHTHTGTTESGGSHTHGGSTGAESASHTHNIGDQVGTGTTGVDASGGGSIPNPAASNRPTGNASNSHTHSFTTDAGGTHTHTFTSAATGGGLLHTNMPPALMLNFIIRYQV
jgi:microcystin-dependent protein